MKKASDPNQAVHFEQIPNIGPRIAGDLRELGLKRPSELRRRDPCQLYCALSKRTGVQQDPCVLDVFISAVRFMQGEPARPWWAYTAERKAMMLGGSAQGSSTRRMVSGRAKNSNAR